MSWTKKAIARHYKTLDKFPGREKYKHVKDSTKQQRQFWEMVKTYPRKIKLYHGTKKTAYDNIIKDGFFSATAHHLNDRIFFTNSKGFAWHYASKLLGEPIMIEVEIPLYYITQIRQTIMGNDSSSVKLNSCIKENGYTIDTLDCFCDKITMSKEQDEYTIWLNLPAKYITRTIDKNSQEVPLYYKTKYINWKNVSPEIIRRLPEAPYSSFYYANNILNWNNVPQPIMQAILKHPDTAYQYSLKKKNTLPFEGILAISTCGNGYYAYNYANNVLNWNNVPQIVIKAIKNDPEYTNKIPLKYRIFQKSY